MTTTFVASVTALCDALEGAYGQLALTMRQITDPSPRVQGATTFHFRSAAIADVLAEATEAAGGLGVRVCGGISTARGFLRAGLVDQLHVAIAPILLGRGNRLWDDLHGLELTHRVTTEVAEGGTIHVTFRR